MTHNQGRTPYYSRGLRERFQIDSLKTPSPAGKQEPAAEIKYEVDEAKYNARVQRNLQAGGLETEVPAGWPTKLDGALVWKPNDFKEEDYVYVLTKNDKAEIESALEHFKTLGLEGEQVSQETFPLPGLEKNLAAVCERVYEGCGFAIVRGLNPDAYSTEDFTIIYLGVSAYIGERRGKQDQRGTMLMHVMKLSQDNRESFEDKPFHTDMVTDALCLVTKNCSASGGRSILASAYTVYNELAATRPDLIHTLAKADWPFDTCGRDPAYYNRAVMFWYHQKLITCFSRRLLCGAEPDEPRTAGIPGLTEAQAEALDAIHFIAKKNELKTRMMKGDLRYINNMAILHRREAFENEGSANRHLIRIWLNNEEMCWKLPQPLRLAWARVFEDNDPSRKPQWELEPVKNIGGHIFRAAPSCD